MNTRDFLFAIAGTLALLTLGYVGLFRWQFGAPIAAEYWVKDVMELKQQLGKRPTGPKFLLVGGSSGLWGFRSDRLEHTLGVPVVNLCLHAGLEFDTHARNALALLRPGDGVLLQIEYGFFNRDRYDKPKSWITNQVMTWFPEYYRDLSPVRKAVMIRSIEPGRVLAGVIARVWSDAIYAQHPRRRAGPVSVSFEDGSRLHLPAGHDSERSRNLDSRGDLATIEEHPDLPDDIQYAIKRLRKRHDLPASMRAFLGEARRRDVRVYFTFPPTLKVETSDFDAPKIRAAVDLLRRLLEAEGVVVLGDPAEFQYPPELFSNTSYHLNRKGREIHTTRVADALTRALSAEREPPYPHP